MFLTVLGMNGPYPAAGGATSGYLVEENDTRILLDMGSGVLGRLLTRLNPCELNAVCLSHLHYDHACDMLPLQYYLQNKPVQLPVYVPGEDCSPMRGMLENPAFLVRDYTGYMQVGDVKVWDVPTRHPVPCRALKLEAGGKTLVYTGDAAEGESLVDFCRGADVLLADAAFLEKQWHENAPHMSARRAAVLARDAGVGRLVLTHLPPFNVASLLLDEAKAVFAQSALAVSGERISV